MTDFVTELGSAVAPHHVRRMLDALIREAGEATAQFGVQAPFRACSFILLLDQEGPLSIMRAAERLQLSHPVIIALARSVRELGLVKEGVAANDARVRLLSLTEAGREDAVRIRRLHAALAKIHDDIGREAGADLVEVSRRALAALKRQPLLERLQHVKEDTRHEPS